MRAGATNEKGRCAGIFHLIVRILTLPPIVIGITVLLMYVPANLLTLRELLLCELFLLLIPHKEVIHGGAPCTAPVHRGSQARCPVGRASNDVQHTGGQLYPSDRI